MHLLSVVLDDAVDQCVVLGQWTAMPPAKAPASSASLPPVDNLTIDNIEDLPPLNSSDSVAQLSKTLIDFLLTRWCCSHIILPPSLWGLLVTTRWRC